MTGSDMQSLTRTPGARWSETPLGRRTICLGRFMLSACEQAPGCPIIDGGRSTAFLPTHAEHWQTIVVCLSSYGGRALVLGRRVRVGGWDTAPKPEQWLWLPSALTRLRPGR